MTTLTRPVSSVKTAIAVRPLVMTSIELVSRKLDEYHLENGHVVYDERTITILSREPLHRQAIHNVMKQNTDFRFDGVKCELYSPVIDVYCEF